MYNCCARRHVWGVHLYGRGHPTCTSVRIEWYSLYVCTDGVVLSVRVYRQLVQVVSTKKYALIAPCDMSAAAECHADRRTIARASIAPMLALGLSVRNIIGQRKITRTINTRIRMRARTYVRVHGRAYDTSSVVFMTYESSYTSYFYSL